jgi:hypothetical protein
MTEEEYFAMINNTEEKTNKKPIYEYNRNNNGKIEINTKNNNLTINDDSQKLIIDNMIIELNNEFQKTMVEIKLYKKMYKKYKKENYKNYYNSLNQKLPEIKNKIETLKEIKDEEN